MSNVNKRRMTHPLVYNLCRFESYARIEAAQLYFYANSGPSIWHAYPGQELRDTGPCTNAICKATK